MKSQKSLATNWSQNYVKIVSNFFFTWKGANVWTVQKFYTLSFLFLCRSLINVDLMRRGDKNFLRILNGMCFRLHSKKYNLWCEKKAWSSLHLKYETKLLRGQIAKIYNDGFFRRFQSERAIAHTTNDRIEMETCCVVEKLIQNDIVFFTLLHIYVE